MVCAASDDENEFRNDLIETIQKGISSIKIRVNLKLQVVHYVQAATIDLKMFYVARKEIVESIQEQIWIILFPRQ